MRPARLVVALAIVAATLGAGAFTVAAAPTLHLVGAAKPAPKAAPRVGASQSKYCANFVADLAHRLGVSEGKLTASVKDSVRKSIDDAVASGDITADQGTRMKARVDTVNGCADLGVLHSLGGKHRGAGMEILSQVTTAAASALQQTPDVVRADVMAGQTLHQIAGLKGITKADFDTAFRAALKTQSEAQVVAGKITVEQQTRLLDHAAAIADKLWDTGLKGYGPGRFPGAPATTR